MVIPNWVFLAVPMALLCLSYWVYDGIRNHIEQRYLHAVFDGDRIQAWKTDRYRSKHNGIRSTGRRFY